MNAALKPDHIVLARIHYERSLAEAKSAKAFLDRQLAFGLPKLPEAKVNEFVTVDGLAMCAHKRINDAINAFAVANRILYRAAYDVADGEELDDRATEELTWSVPL